MTFAVGVNSIDRTFKKGVIPLGTTPLYNLKLLVSSGNFTLKYNFGIKILKKDIDILF